MSYFQLTPFDFVVNNPALCHGKAQLFDVERERYIHIRKDEDIRHLVDTYDATQEVVIILMKKR
jgi:hypothetical protein